MIVFRNSWTICMVLCLLSIQAAFSQNVIRPSSLDKKCAKKYRSALTDFRKQDFKSARKNFLKILKNYPELVEAQIKLAQIEYQTGSLEEALASFYKITSSYPDYDPKLYLAIGKIEEELQEDKKAIEAYKKYLSYSSASEQRSRIVKHLEQLEFRTEFMKEKQDFHPMPLSDLVNTEAAEYEISFTVDESRFYFTRRERNQEDLYIAYLENGEVTRVETVAQINTPYNEGAHAISSDGKTLILTICDAYRTMGSCDLFMSQYRSGRWSKPKNLGSQVNSEYWDAQPSISGDGQSLYFSSNRKGGYGANDLWKSSKNEDGDWSKPINLGDQINTSGNDESPFMHKDNQSLYFSSDGRQGMGQLDLFLARRSQWTDRWDSIYHLPYPINTLHDDRGLKVSLDGTKAYFATNRKDAKSIDIYQFELAENLRPVKSSYIRLQILDALSQEPLNARLSVTDYENPNAILKTQADQGTATISFPLGKAMSIHVTHPGYSFHSDKIIANKEASEPIEKTILLYKIRTDTVLAEPKSIVLNNIFFASGSPKLLDHSFVEIEKLFLLLVDNPKSRIRITGHTDDIGSASDNLLLSEERAKSVYNALIEKGIAPDRVEYRGMGESQPIDTNKTEKGRQKNRRTEFQILYQ